jgi:dynein regulatory complex subunit 2
MKRLLKLQETMAQYKARLGLNAKEFEEKNRALREEKDAIQKQYHGLKKMMVEMRELEHKKLVELTLLSQATRTKLEAKVGVAEDIVRLAEMNRKLETEVEKVSPFYPESEDVVAAGEADAATADIPKEIQTIAQFQKRYNKVQLDQLALDQKLKALGEENAYLKAILRQYLDGIAVNQDVLAHANPLVIVNGITNAPMPKSLGKHITVVEGAHHVAAYAVRS